MAFPLHNWILPKNNKKKARCKFQVRVRQKKGPDIRQTLCAGSETRTRMTVKSLVFETSASTIPPFPPLFLSGCKGKKVFFNAQQISFF